MEIKLGRQRLAYFKKLVDTVFEHEETMESVVPDTQPDVGDVCDVFGTAVMRVKENRQGEIFASGQVQGCVLYIPEGESAARGIEVSMPWSVSCDCTGMDTTGRSSICVQLTSLEARVINSRKLILRALVSVSVKGWAACEAEWSSQADAGTELLMSEVSLTAATDVIEKTFSISEDAELPSSAPPIGRVLGCRAALYADDVSASGRRMMLSGRMEVTVLYTAQMNGALASASFVKPFSQVLDLMDESTGDFSAEADVMPTGVYVREAQTNDAVSHTVLLEITAAAQLVVSRPVNIRYIKDMYTVDRRSSYTTEKCSFDSVAACEHLDFSMRENITCQVGADGILMTRIVPGKPVLSEGNVRLPVKVCVLAVNDEGKPALTESRCEMETAAVPAILPGDVLRAGVRDVTALLSAQGVEVRASGAVDVRRVTSRDIAFVGQAEAEDETEEKRMPSVIVARAGVSDTIWSLAKRHCTTREAIRTVNSLEPDAEIASGDILLITRN